jgi:hypothetical protein
MNQNWDDPNGSHHCIGLEHMLDPLKHHRLVKPCLPLHSVDASLKMLG